jgi:capsid protein
MTKMILEPLIRSARNFFHNVRHKKASVPYDGAGHGKRLGNWYPSSSSINAILASNLSVLRTRSHDIVRKNPYASNAIETIVSNTRFMFKMISTTSITPEKAAINRTVLN